MSTPAPPGAPGLELDEALRDRLAAGSVDAAPASAPPACTAAAEDSAQASADVHRPVFTGDGGEYFRIWVVNLLLTLVTLGVYSAWAKVRKTRYFWRNTRLDGHVFDYHANPLAILRGRLLALGLLGAYTWAFDISVAAGVATLLALCLLGPWLFAAAQQFRLRNTSHRGLRFDFRAGRAATLRRLLPLPLVWFSSTLLAVLLTEQVAMIVAAAVLTAVLVPWMHHRLKHFQHANAAYGDLPSEFDGRVRGFYGVHLRAVLLLSLAVGTATFGGTALGAGVVSVTQHLPGVEESLVLELWAVVLFVAVSSAYLAVWAYFAVRVQQLVWRATRLGDIRFDTRIRAREYAGLVLRCVVLTVLTLGLYWPWAAVRLARYRVQCMEVSNPRPLEQQASAVRRAPASAAGEGAVDVFGLDVGL